MIRKIRKNDANRVKELFNLFPVESRSILSRELQDIFEEKVEGYAFDDKTSFGYMVLRKWGGIYFLDTLIVDKKSQGKGVGRKLIEFAKKRCVDENLPQITVCTFFGDKPGFYIALDFVSIGKLKGPFVPVDKERNYFKWVNPKFS